MVVHLIILPLFPATGVWALCLVVADMGLTGSRLIGIAILGLLGAAGFWGALSVARRLHEWPAPMVKANAPLLGLTLTIVLAMLTPALDPWAISAADQYRRLADGAIDPDKFDFDFLRNDLGAHGARQVQRIKDNPRLMANPQIRQALGPAN